MKYWTREAWLQAGTEEQRRATAKLNPLAWIFEYEPTILFPGKGYIPLIPYPFQQDFIRCRDRFRAINKPRQCGISTIAAAEVAWEFCNVPGAQIVIISKDKDAAINFHTYVYAILHSVKDKDPNFPKLVKENERVTTNENGAKITSLAAGAETGRSFSATHLIFDEMAFAQYADDIWQAAAPTLTRTGGRATVISTPKGRANLFAQIFEKSDHMGFTIFNYGWWDVPDYNPFYDQMIAAESATERKQWIEKAKQGEWYKINRTNASSELKWKQEFEGAFDANQGTVLSTRSLEKCFMRNYLTPQEDPRGVFDVWYSKPKVEGHFYATATDLGRKNDPTVQITYDITNWPAEVVEFIRIEPGRADWEMIGAAVRSRLEYWQPEEAIHDGTGVGDTMSEVLYGLSEPFYFTKAAKQNIIERMQHAFDHGKLRLPKIEVLYREHQRYIWDDKDIVQDTVMANAMAISIFYEIDAGFVGFDPTINFIDESAVVLA